MHWLLAIGVLSPDRRQVAVLRRAYHTTTAAPAPRTFLVCTISLARVLADAMSPRLAATATCFAAFLLSRCRSRMVRSSPLSSFLMSACQHSVIASQPAVAQRPAAAQSGVQVQTSRQLNTYTPAHLPLPDELLGVDLLPKPVQYGGLVRTEHVHAGPTMPRALVHRIAVRLVGHLQHAPILHT